MFGKNVIVKKQRPVDYDGTIKIQSVFYTIQGEGPFGGEPAVFVRFRGCNLACQFCLTASAKIDTPTGKKPIEEIEVGDVIYAFDQKAGKVVEAPVTHVHPPRKVDTLIRVQFVGQLIFSTPEHPFFTTNRGWVEAKNLVVGDVLFNLTASDRMSLHNPMKNKEVVEKVVATNRANRAYEVIDEIVSISRKKKKEWTALCGGADESAEVYNFEVAGPHTYFANGVLHHNCDTDFESGTAQPTVKDLVSQIEELLPDSCALVVITGGEPMLQAGIIELTDMLLNSGYRVQIETAGTVYQPLDYGHDNLTIVCSPKTGSLNKELVQHIDCYKYVVRDGEYSDIDGLPTVSPGTGKPLPTARPHAGFFGEIYINPIDDRDTEQTQKNYMAAGRIVMQHGYRLGVQMHKLVEVE